MLSEAKSCGCRPNAVSAQTGLSFVDRRRLVDGLRAPAGPGVGLVWCCVPGYPASAGQTAAQARSSAEDDHSRKVWRLGEDSPGYLATWLSTGSANGRPTRVVGGAVWKKRAREARVRMRAELVEYSHQERGCSTGGRWTQRGGLKRWAWGHRQKGPNR